MKKKSKDDDSQRIVFSTDPSFSFNNEQPPVESLPPSQQKLRIKLETKHRAGKLVTLVQGYSGNEEDLAQLGKQLKTFCGTGGSVKDGDIIIQGDHREKILHWLIKNGYKNSR